MGKRGGAVTTISKKYKSCKNNTMRMEKKNLAQGK